MSNALGKQADDLFKDEDFVKLLAEMKKSNPNLKQASKMKTSQAQSLSEQVKGRCAFAEAGFAFQAICGSPLSAKGFVPTQKPPVPNGMMHCVNELKRIVIDEYDAKKASEFHKVCNSLIAYAHMY